MFACTTDTCLLLISSGSHCNSVSSNRAPEMTSKSHCGSKFPACPIALQARSSPCGLLLWAVLKTWHALIFLLLVRRKTEKQTLSTPYTTCRQVPCIVIPGLSGKHGESHPSLPTRQCSGSSPAAQCPSIPLIALHCFTLRYFRV